MPPRLAALSGSANLHKLVKERCRALFLRITRCIRSIPLAIVLAGVIPQALRADEKGAAEAVPTVEHVEFFEKHVRPVLAEHCQACHGVNKQEAGLRLDIREAALNGSESGPVIVPGNPEQSKLVAAIRYTADIQMPPDGKLADEQLAALVEWIKLGAPWPAEGTRDSAAAAGTSARPPAERIDEIRAAHWAFRHVARPAPPAVNDRGWCATPLDAFILHELESRGLSPSARADRRTLLRRASFDLTGLPPSADDIEAFERDDSPAAWERAVDRLLASPHYGERWGRHWLDVARYADTKGYVFTQERRYPFSYTFRDYVVRSFNEDLPYDRFVVEQLAADQLPAADPRSMAALGFLTLGRRFMFNENDIIDDRIDVVSRGLLGLTVTCARCHDHKFDPVPTSDYYSLYGVFASSVEPDEGPLLGPPEESAAYHAFMQELTSRRQAFDTFRDEKHRELEHELRLRAGDYLAMIASEKGAEHGDDQAAVSLGAGELRRRIVERWREYLKQSAARHDPVFALWHEFAALDEANFAEKSREITERIATAANSQHPVNSLVRDAFAKGSPSTMADVARLYGGLLAMVEEQWTAAQTATPPADKLADPAAEEMRQVLYGPGSPTVVDAERARRLFNRDVQGKLGELHKKIEEWEVNSPGAPPRAMALADAPEPREPHIFVRGNPERAGPPVPRQFLAVLTPAERRPFAKGSGRLELAEAIANRDNPLTARVLVNRVWLHHFGAGLVRTPSDFGTRSDPPSHPALLDWLAATFIDEGWSLKKLHRAILLSSTYQQSSAPRPECLAVDAENQWLWRMNRQRLDFEAMRDATLAVAGRLDRMMGGRPVELWQAPYSLRQTVYGFIDRQDLPGVFRVFDFANPDVSNDQRPKTTVPQQALFAMNSPFVIEQAKALAARPEVAGESDVSRRVAAIYRLALGRAPTADECEMAGRFIAAPLVAGETRLTAWELLAQVLLCTNEFVFVD
jgi:hypothetical protein